MSTQVHWEKRIANIHGNIIKLSQEYNDNAVWIGHSLAQQQLRAAWLRFSKNDQPMNPRLVGKPGIGKTTLAVSVSQELNLPVFVMQGTGDTRPEDLIISAILGENQQIHYVASPLVTAMLVGGVCILDEGNRMSEKSWASLAPLLDHRRYVDSILMSERIVAHEDFRFVTTMNDDASVYDLPEYIQSRLNPQILLEFPDSDTERRIIKEAVPYASDELINYLINFLIIGHQFDESYSVRDGIQIAKYAQRLKSIYTDKPMSELLRCSLEAVLGAECLKYISDSERNHHHLRPLK